MKWVYERWTPKWPDTPGTPYPFETLDQGRVLSYDGTLQESARYNLIATGAVFYGGGGLTSNPIGYYRKTSDTTATYLGTDPPLPIKDTLIDTIEAEEGTFPDDGVHSDGYWYIKVKPVFPTMRILRNGQWVEVETGYVLKDGVWKPIEEIYKLQDGQWVQA